MDGTLAVLVSAITMAAGSKVSRKLLHFTRRLSAASWSILYIAWAWVRFNIAQTGWDNSSLKIRSFVLLVKCYGGCHGFSSEPCREHMFQLAWIGCSMFVTVTSCAMPIRQIFLPVQGYDFRVFPLSCLDIILFNGVPSNCFRLLSSLQYSVNYRYCCVGMFICVTWF